MAQIQLGTIITDIKGSIAGTTFRKSQHTISVYNKIGRNYKNSSKRNSRAGQFANLSTRYNNLSEVERAWWADNATRFTFLNKFGSPVLLTARQLFIKLNMQLSVVGEQVPNTGTMVSDTESTEISSFAVDVTTQSVEVEITERVENSYLCFYAQVVNNGRTLPNQNKKQVFFFISRSSDTTFSIGPEFFSQLPFVAEGQKIQLTCYTINDFGFVSNSSNAFSVAGSS